MLHDLTLAAAIDEFRKTKAYAERAFAQLRDEDFFVRLNPRQSSIAAYVRHLAGNMRSRWTDFLATDGEKPDRDREGEFAETPIPRAELLATWDQGWHTLFAALDSLKPNDLERTIYIRKEPHSVIQAIIRQIAHYTWHVGQIVLLAKHIKTTRNEPWNYMTIPPGGSQAFNRDKGL
ncbi:MAG TPA: DUF1572 family protein [Tepidisphaeraceae bacterium]|jgi:hypothetical protein